MLLGSPEATPVPEQQLDLLLLLLPELLLLLFGLPGESQATAMLRASVSGGVWLWR